MSKDTTALAVHTPPELITAIEVSPAWIQKRDTLLATAGEFKTIPNNETLQAAIDTLSDITRHSNSLETLRKHLTGPFNDAASKIKRTSDEARNALEIEKERLKRITGLYVENERRRAAEEAARIEREQREAAEKAVAQQEAANELLDHDFQLKATVEVPAAPTPTITPPKAFGVSMPTIIEFQIEDPDAVPIAFCTVDERKVNAYIRENKDAIKLKVAGGQATQIIQGIKFTTRIDPRSR